MPASGPETIRRYKRLRDVRRNHEERWDILAPFTAPSRLGVRTKMTEGQSKTDRVFDSTAMFAADILAKFIVGNINNPAAKWFNLKMRDSDLNTIDSVKEWLEETRDRMLADLSSSNFYAEVYEMYIDYSAFGTGSMFAVEKPQPVNETILGYRGTRFKTHMIGRYVIAENDIGMVDTHMVEFPISARAAVMKWGLDKLPALMTKAASKPETQDNMFTVVHAVYPRPEGDRGGAPTALGMPFISQYVEMETQFQIDEGGFDEFPFFNPRWTVPPEEIYGMGPGELSLPDVRTLNKAKEMGLEDFALKLRPPTLAAHGSVLGGTIRLRPGATTIIRTAGKRIDDLIRPYETGSHPEITMIKEEELRKSIRQAYFVDQIVAMLEVDKPQMTAFEFAKKIELLNRILGPVYGRLSSEFLVPHNERQFNMMFRQGAFSDPPDELFDEQGQGREVDVEFESPLARAQRSGEIDALTQALEDLKSIAEIKPGAIDILNEDKAARLIFDVRGVPASVANSEDEIAEIRKAKAEETARQKQLEEVQVAAEAIGKAAPALSAVQQQTGVGG